MPTMLPSTPKSFGDVRRVFSSALDAIKGEANYFGFPTANQAVVILVDGLGTHNIKQRAGHAPNLNRLLSAGGSISVGFPTTTATSITSFATGLEPSDHGIVGYRIREPKTQSDLNFLRWGSQWNAREFAFHPTVTETAETCGVKTYFIGAPEYASSQFTSITFPNAKYVAARTISESFESAFELLARKERSLTYLYIPYLDQTAHALGWQSARWSQLLEELDSAVRHLEKHLKKGQAALLTADHGVVDVSVSSHIFLDEFDCLQGQVAFVGGDTRAPMLYLNAPERAEQLSAELSNQLGSRAYVLTKAELITTNWFGELGDTYGARLGDITLLARSQVAFYHREFSSANSMKMIGHHGALSSEELTVPLLRFGQFA